MGFTAGVLTGLFLGTILGLFLAAVVAVAREEGEMVTIHPPPVRELVERIQHTLEWERWYRERQNLDKPAIRAMKLQDIDGALVALEQLEAIAREGSA